MGGYKNNYPYVMNNLPVGSTLFDFLPCWPPSLVRDWNDSDMTVYVSSFTNIVSVVARLQGGWSGVQTLVGARYFSL
jgi:hypothetical protein